MGRSAIHPGEHLAEQLEELGMSAAELARQLGVPTNRITAILHGQRAITGDSALRLGHFFGNSPLFWLNLQAAYELRVAEQKSGEAIEALPTLARRKPAKARSAAVPRRWSEQPAGRSADGAGFRALWRLEDPTVSDRIDPVPRYIGRQMASVPPTNMGNSEANARII